MYVMWYWLPFHWSHESSQLLVSAPYFPPVVYSDCFCHSCPLSSPTLFSPSVCVSCKRTCSGVSSHASAAVIPNALPLLFSLLIAPWKYGCFGDVSSLSPSLSSAADWRLSPSVSWWEQICIGQIRGSLQSNKKSKWVLGGDIVLADHFPVGKTK